MCSPFLLSALVASVAVASIADTRWDPERRLTRGRGAQASINFARNIAADERGRVYLAWSERLDGGHEIFTKRSADGGKSWSLPLRLTQASGDSHYPSIAAGGDRVHVAWWDTRDGHPVVYYKRSIDAGLSWSADRAISDIFSGAAHPSIAVTGDAVHVAYVDVRQNEVYYARSLDGGNVWETPVRLSDVPYNSYTPTIAASGEHVYVAWTDTRDFKAESTLEEEYFIRSVDGGTSWGPNVRLTIDAPDRPANSWAPSLAADAADVWMVWFDDRDGNWEIYTKRSSDHGVTWSADRRLTASFAPSVRPSIAQQGSSLFVVWWDGRDGNEEIYAKRSPDRGVTWEDDVRLSNNPAQSVFASVAAASSGVHVIWQDGRDGRQELYYTRVPGRPVAVRNGRIAFHRHIAGVPQIFTIEPDGSDQRQLTSNGANLYPSWTRDGSRIVFTSGRSGTPELWVMNGDGSNPQQLTANTPGANFTPEVSHDGTRIAFTGMRQDVGLPEVWVMNADGGEAQRLTYTPRNSATFNWSLNPTWHPDDVRIYYASTVSGSSQIWGMFANGQGQKQKTGGLGPHYPHANAPEFSRDGTEVTFWAGFENEYGEVWTMNTDGSDPRPVTETSDPRNADNPAWSPDGSQIAFDTNRDGPIQIWSVRANGSDARMVIPDAGGGMSWQPLFDTFPLPPRERPVRWH